MYTIRQLTGNLLIVSPLPLPEPKTASGLFIPNTKGKETVCEVIKIGNEVTNPMIKIGDLVTVDSDLWHLDGEFNKIESPVKVKVLPKSLRILV